MHLISFIYASAPRRTFLRCLCLLIFGVGVFGLFFTNATAQETTINNSVTLRVTATIQENNRIELQTLREINIGQVQPGMETIDINPVTDPEAGLLRALGEPDTSIQINFVEERLLTTPDSDQALRFIYVVSGNSIEEQQLSELLTADTRDLRMNEDGEFYFWIGGFVDLSGASQGNYEGEFTIEIEYL